MQAWTKAFNKYGAEACRKAYQMNVEGFGARGISYECAATIKTTRQADAAINAWRAFDAHMQSIRYQD